jgi:hypothetical protein
MDQNELAFLRYGRKRRRRISLVKYAEKCIGTLTIVEDEGVDEAEWNRANEWPQWCLQEVEAGTSTSPR